MLESRASRVVDCREVKKTITRVDAEEAITKMINDRKPKVDPKVVEKSLEIEKMMQKQLKVMGKMRFWT